MRASLAAVLVLVAVCALPASAATLDPRALVLRQADVPSGFRFDASESGVRSNTRRARDDPGFAPLIARSGRITGYETVFVRYRQRRRSVELIESLADIYHRPDGAAIALDWVDREIRKHPTKVVSRSPGQIGAQAWIYTGRTPGRFSLVAWRHGRVVAIVFGLQVPRDQTVALAKAQQRRIAARVR